MTSTTITSSASAIALAAICALSSSTRVAAQETPDQPKPAMSTAERVDSTKAIMLRWSEIRDQISKLRAQWREQKEALKNRIELREADLVTLRAKIEETSKSVVETETKRDELKKERESLEKATEGLAARVEALEERTRNLLPQLPDPVHERIRLIKERLPKKGEETKLSLGARYVNVAGILQEIDKFNREIYVTTELRDVGGGAEAEVTTIYTGLGQAAYVTADGKYAGIGRPSHGGWVWTPKNDAAPQVANAIRVYRSEIPAAFVRIPARIQ